MNRFALASAKMITRTLGEHCVLTIDGIDIAVLAVWAPSEDFIDPDTGSAITRQETLTIAREDLPVIPATNTTILFQGKSLFVLHARERGPAVVIELTKRRVR